MWNHNENWTAAAAVKRTYDSSDTKFLQQICNELYLFVCQRALWIQRARLEADLCGKRTLFSRRRNSYFLDAAKGIVASWLERSSSEALLLCSITLSNYEQKFYVQHLLV